MSGSSLAGSSGYLKNVNVLVAEDNEFARQIVREVLNALGANRVFYAKDGRQALEMCHDHAIEIALIDWEMPVVSGLEMLKSIRTSSNSPNKFLPVIMMTAYSELHHVTLARDAGVSEYLIKPFSARQMLSRIRAAIENPRDFVKTEKYFGPDRRRKKDPKYRGRERRKDAEKKEDETADD